MYTREQLLEETSKYYNNVDDLATEVWINKYASCNENKTEFYELTPDDMHRRLAKEFERIEYKYLQQLPENLKGLSEYGKARIKALQEFARNCEHEFVYDFFKNFCLIIPAGSVMEACGTNKIQSLANCFVVKIPNDSVEDIYMSAHSAAQIGKRRGGIGTDMSRLRPKGALLNNAAKESSGAIDWMKMYDVTGKIIGQNNRKMAMMLSLDIRHPDIEEFITCKQKLDAINNANISTRMCNEFLKAVKEDKDFMLSFPCDIVPLEDEVEVLQDLKYGELTAALDKYNDNFYLKKVKAKEIWDKIIKSAWKTAEPGILNWDKIIDYDPTSVYKELKPCTTNPCGELPLAEFDSCRLIHVNLFELVDNPFKPNAALNVEKAYKTFYECQVQADNLVDLEIEAVDRILTKIRPEYADYELQDKEYFLQDYNVTEEFMIWWTVRRIAREGRRTGCGFTGYGDMCAALGLGYGHEDTLVVFKAMMAGELDATIDMAITRGTFPLWQGDKEYAKFETGGHPYWYQGKNEWYQFVLDEFPNHAMRMIKYGRRNAGLSTVAPTGTVSIVAQTTSGIEPLFKPYYVRRKVLPNDAEKFDFQDVNGKKYSEHVVVHPKLRMWLQEGGYVHYKLEEDCTEEDWKLIYEQSPYFGQCAENIWHVSRMKLQAKIQKYISASISSTINLPETATIEDVELIYNLVFDLGCKGVTVYRDGSRAGILVDKTPKFSYEDSIRRPKLVECDIHVITALKDRWLVAVGIVEGKPYEIFAIPYNNILEHLGLTSLKKFKEIRFCIIKIKKLKYSLVNCETKEVIIEDIVSLMDNDSDRSDTKCISLELRHKIHPKWIARAIDKKFGTITSFDKAIGRVLKKYIKDGEESGSICDDCNDKLIYRGGCPICPSCGNSKCG
jgi:ribonucleoside-diphosphate reductase alpha chain